MQRQKKLLFDNTQNHQEFNHYQNSFIPKVNSITNREKFQPSINREDEFTDLSKRLSFYISENAQLKKTLDLTNSQTKIKYSFLDEKKSLLFQIQSLNNHNQILQDKIKMLSQNISHLQSSTPHLQQKLSSLSTTISKLSNNNIKLKNNLRLLVDENKEAAKRIRILNHNHLDNDNKFHKFSIDNNKLLSQITKEQERNNDLFKDYFNKIWGDINDRTTSRIY